MNELTREASKQTILEAISFLWLGGRGRVRKSLRTQQKPLKHDFQRYTTTVYGSEYADVTQECELPPEYQNHLDRKYVKNYDGPLDVAAFRAWCEELDKDQEWIEKTEKELF